MHRHDYDFQFNFVQAGEIDLVIDGIDDKKTCRAGDTFFLPHKIVHNETRVSDDFQNLQVYGPSKSNTVQLEAEIDWCKDWPSWAKRKAAPYGLRLLEI